MNNLSFAIYFASVADGLRGFIQFIGGSSLLIYYFVFTISFIVKYLEKPDDPIFDKVSKHIYKFTSAGFLLIVISLLIPNKETSMMIISSEVGDRLIHSQKINDKIADPVLDYINEWLKKQKEDMNKGKKNG